MYERLLARNLESREATVHEACYPKAVKLLPRSNCKECSKPSFPQDRKRTQTGFLQLPKRVYRCNSKRLKGGFWKYVILDSPAGIEMALNTQ